MQPNEYSSLPVSTLKGLLRIAGSDVFRPNLAAIRFEPDGYAVATDGSIILALRIPTFDGEGFSVPRGEVEAAIKGQKPRASVHITETHIGMRVYTCNRMYPDWRRPLVPSGIEPSAPAPLQYFSCELMERFRRAFDDINNTKRSGVFVEPDDFQGCALIRTGPHMLAGIMPMRCTKPWDSNAVKTAFFKVQP